MSIPPAKLKAAESERKKAFAEEWGLGDYDHGTLSNDKVRPILLLLSHVMLTSFSSRTLLTNFYGSHANLEKRLLHSLFNYLAYPKMILRKSLIWMYIIA